MEDGDFKPNSTVFGTISNESIGLDLMDELLYDGYWLETTDGSNFWQPTTSASAIDFPSYTEANIQQHLNQNLHQKSNQEETLEIERSKNLSDHRHPPLVVYYSQLEGSQTEEPILTQAASSSSSGGKKPEVFQVEEEEEEEEGTTTVTESSKKILWIAPREGNPNPPSSMKKRLIRAIECLRESTKDSDILVQIWVPIKRGGRQFLTTNNQPFSLDPNSKSLQDYRDVSKKYQFAAEVDSKELVGLPGRVFLKKFPEWTPDVRFFRREEYPRVNYAHQYNVSGSLALPVFEQGSGTCLGVVEIVTTAQKVNYRPEVENICKALEAVDLRSSEIFSPPNAKVCDESYQAALAEIQVVLKYVCDTHGLPLAQTWAPCIQHGKGGCRHSDENYTCCVSTIDSACYVPDPQVLGFHEACSEHHLLRGEGVAGGAFMTNQPCFFTDITALSKTEYPLSHHARMFELHAAVAVRLRSFYTGSADFVLEFFLPKHCRDTEQQKQMVNSITSVIQQVCRSLRVVTGQELEQVTVVPVREIVVDTPKLLSSPSKESFQEEPSWMAHMMEAQHKGKGVAVSVGDHKEEPKEEFKVTTDWDNYDLDFHRNKTFSESKLFQQDSGPQGFEGSGDFSSGGSHRAPGARKGGEKRRSKIEKTISLQVLRQYFSGTLKDAAKSIGVCPTTLKRICRQHGITRWPSRKIKKVGHSLRKLQLVIDSVQGADGAIQLSSFYTNFPELGSPSVPGTSTFSISSKMSDPCKQLQTQPEGSLLSPGTTSSKSASSSCSHSSGSSSSCPSGSKQALITTNTLGSGDALLAEKPSGMIKRVHSDTELNDSAHEEMKLLVRSHSHNLIGDPPFKPLPPLPKKSSQISRDSGAFKVKATFGEEKIRFSMQQDWGYVDLLREVARRFNIEDVSKFDLKYLDDDSEWVLLTCDDDLEECIDIHRSSRSRTIKLSLHLSFHLNLGSSFGSSGPS